MLTSSYPLLDSIGSPKDLRSLSQEKLPEVCKELRNFQLEVLSQHPGHLGSSLGAVDLAVALHYVFKTPYDRIVWDVGHQAYAHKILTGRKEAFETLRQWGGIAGFPLPEESEYDTFPAGHASNSISAALGMSVAAELRKEKRNIVAVIGDGSMTGGLAFEGLNNASSYPNNLLVILNDNNMSIDANVGGLNKYLVDLNTSRTYNTVRYDVYQGLKHIKLINDGNKRNILRLNNSIKSLFSNNQSSFFDGLSIRYFGPIDGNDVLRLVEVLRKIKDLRGPKILHIRTIKGKGYAAAEKEPTLWHAPGKFNVQTAERSESSAQGEPPKFQDVFGQTLVELAAMDERIAGITPAMPTGCSMTQMMREYPDRSFDVGIAEGHAVTFSAGLAREGMIPFCNIYSSFAQRAYDQLIHDVCLPHYHIVLCLDRAGLVGEDGATHQGAFDLSYLSCIPNLTIAAPRNEHLLRNLMYTAYKGQEGPFAIRYPRGKGSCPDWKNELQLLPIGKGELLQEGSEVAILSIGSIAVEVQKALAILKERGISIPAHYDMIFLKPFDRDLLQDIAQRYNAVVTVEDGAIHGGLGSTVLEYLAEVGYKGSVKRLGIPDQFIPHGTPKEQYAYSGIDAQSIVESVLSIRKNL